MDKTPMLERSQLFCPVHLERIDHSLPQQDLKVEIQVTGFLLRTNECQARNSPARIPHSLYLELQDKPSFPPPCLGPANFPSCRDEWLCWPSDTFLICSKTDGLLCRERNPTAEPACEGKHGPGSCSDGHGGAGGCHCIFLCLFMHT